MPDNLPTKLSISQRAYRKSQRIKRRVRALKREYGLEKRSVYFYTFHKCASSLFGSFVLPSIQKLEHVDYERSIYGGKISEDDPDSIVFERDGFLYGPIRLSGGVNGGAARKILDTAHPPLVTDNIAVCLLRDPRDILVSRYFSFAFSHSESSVPHIAARQREGRRLLVEQGVDDYTLSCLDGVRQDFELVDQISRECRDSVVLRYEDMVENYDQFANDLTRYLVLGEDVINEIYRRSRPRQKEDISSHKRSGRSGTFAEKLKPETVEIMNDKLAGVLKRFGYTS